MEFEGIVYKVMPVVSGNSSKGAWKKQDVVFEMPSEFSRKICVTFFGDKAEDSAGLQPGDAVTMSVNVESREYNDKWYTDVKAWRTVRKGAGKPAPSLNQMGAPAASNAYAGSPAAASTAPVAPAGGFDDAPFNETTSISSSDDVDDMPF